MGSATAAERKSLHCFHGHRFDWRWEVLEEVVDQLLRVWDTLKKYFDKAALTKNGELKGYANDTLGQCLASEPGSIMEGVLLKTKKKS